MAPFLDPTRRLPSTQPEQTQAVENAACIDFGEGQGCQFDTTDFHVEAIDLLSNNVPCEAGIAVGAVVSTIKNQSVLAGLMILGYLTIQGNIEAVERLPSHCRSA